MCIRDRFQSDPGAQQYRQGVGSGFVFDNQGHIVTNNHVVQGADLVRVTFVDDFTVPAAVVGTDPDSDLAVIRVDVDAEHLHPLLLADSDEVRPGLEVVAIGNPFGLRGTMTHGIVSAMTSAQNPHGGQEATILSLYTTMYHWGAIVVAPGYSDPSIFAGGGNPYGTSVTVDQEGKMVEDVEAAVKYQAKRTVTVAQWLKQGAGN